MDLQECIDFANENTLCFMATVENGMPRVRTVMLMFADERGFYFETLSPTGFSRQLHRSPNIEVCFYNNPTDMKDAKEMRISGEIEFVEDEKVKQRIYEKVSFLEEWSPRPIKPILEIFRIKTGDAHFWTMADMLHESEVEHTKFEVV